MHLRYFKQWWRHCKYSELTNITLFLHFIWVPSFFEFSSHLSKPFLWLLHHQILVNSPIFNGSAPQDPFVLTGILKFWNLSGHSHNTPQFCNLAAKQRHFPLYLKFNEDRGSRSVLILRGSPNTQCSAWLNNEMNELYLLSTCISFISVFSHQVATGNCQTHICNPHVSLSLKLQFKVLHIR